MTRKCILLALVCLSVSGVFAQSDTTLSDSAKRFEILKGVRITGHNSVSEANRQAYNIHAVDAKKFHNTTLDLAQVLDKVSGVRVRETGGVGSSVNISLNGFTGRQVKFFIDGIPMDNFGSSFQVNNIPVNLAQRIDVYKGVVPISLGGDALGGAVNIITGSRFRNYLDVSYSFGSFNTHRTAINTAFTTKSGFTTELNLFQNYSDNNYRVQVPVVEDLMTGYTYMGWARRFHDTYHNETAIVNMGVVGKRYADRLLVGLTLGQNHADVQTGNRMFDVYGERRRRGNIVMPSVKYAKDGLFTEGLSLSLSANYNFGQEQTIDTAFKMYNWLGEFIYKGTDPDRWMAGGERGRTLYKYRNNSGVLNSSLSYRFLDKHALSLNLMYTAFNRKGADELFPEDENAKQPRKTYKTILGLGYRFDASSKWTTTLFLKEYFQHNTSFQVLDRVYYRQESRNRFTGFGIASSYFFTEEFQAKGSFEKSYRLPENEELFGDVGNIDPNFTLKPERSYNLNAGMNYTRRFNENHRLYLEGNFIFRFAKDFIRPVVTTIGTAQLKNGNIRDVINNGVDGEIRYTYRSMLSASVNFTYQNIRNNTEYEGTSTTISPVYKDRIPNMPFLFGNANGSVLFKDVGQPGNTLSVGYTLLYVHAFYLRWPSQGDNSLGKDDVPEQWAHDANIVYTMKEGKYNIAVEGRNLANNLLFDNFSLQKPTRAFYLKLRYFLSTKN